LVLLH
jgi:hypothetical protein